MQAKQIVHLDTCQPDYFQGFGGEVFAIPTDSTQTYADIYQAIVEDYNSGDGEEIENLNDCLNALFKNCPMQEIAFPDIEPDEKETVYSYFGVVV